jgi:hypothetical protein
LRELQDEHDDLLGLVAQQELEIGVFRTSVQASGGYVAVEEVSRKAQELAIEKYGVYTDFRGGDDQ